MNEHYRKGVSIWLYHQEEVLLVQPPPSRSRGWRFPSEGVKQGENLEETVQRGLYEELGITTSTLLDRSTFKRAYNWSKKAILGNKHIYGKEFIGQIHTPFLVGYSGRREEIQALQEEIDELRWVRPEEFNEYFFFKGQLEHAQKVAYEFGLLY